MSKKLILPFALLLILQASPASAGARAGFGIHWLNTYGAITEQAGFNPNASSFWGSLQLAAPIFRVEGDVEWVPDYGGSGKSMFNFHGYGLASLAAFYMGLGIGASNYDGNFLGEPFYALRAGVDVGLGGVRLDVNLNFRFQNTKLEDTLEELDMHAIAVGAFLRWEL